MTFLWVLAIGSGLLACAALIMCRQTAARLAQLTMMYWELKYDHGELKAQVKGSAEEESKASTSANPVQAFVPLGDLRKRT